MNSVLKALEQNREKQRQSDPSLSPFKIQVEVTFQNPSLTRGHTENGNAQQWNRAAADGQFRKPASNAKLARLLKENGVDFKFTPFEQGIP